MQCPATERSWLWEAEDSQTLPVGQAVELREKHNTQCSHLLSEPTLHHYAVQSGLRAHDRCWAPQGASTNWQGLAFTLLLSSRNTNSKIKAGRQFMRSILSELKLERAVNSHRTSRFTHFRWNHKLNIKHTFLSNHIPPREGWGLPVYFFNLFHYVYKW